MVGGFCSVSACSSVKLFANSRRRGALITNINAFNIMLIPRTQGNEFFEDFHQMRRLLFSKRRICIEDQNNERMTELIILRVFQVHQNNPGVVNRRPFHQIQMKWKLSCHFSSERETIHVKTATWPCQLDEHFQSISDQIHEIKKLNNPSPALVAQLDPELMSKEQSASFSLVWF